MRMNIDLKKIRHVAEVAHSESITTASHTLNFSARVNTQHRGCREATGCTAVLAYETWHAINRGGAGVR